MNSKIVPCLLFLLGIQICTGLRSQGIFQLRVQNLVNKLDRSCSSPGGSTGAQCQTKFRICLQHFQTTIDPSLDCTFGERFLTFNRDSAKKEAVEFPIDFKWPGTFSLIIEAWSTGLRHSSDVSRPVVTLATSQQLDSGLNWMRQTHQEEGFARLDYEFRLVCSQHYYGAHCDDFCRPRDDQFGHYECGTTAGEKICLEGYQKDPLNPDDEYCTKAICLPGCHPDHGTCQVPGECKCGNGWTGPLCDQCIRYPGCQHGSCQEPWQCNCHKGWGGLFCNQDLNYCTTYKPCKNGATCFNTGQGSYSCSCPPGYTGINCDMRIINECSHQNCLNGGTCQESGSDDFTCICPVGFHGKLCELEALTCSDRPCRNGGQCFNKLSGYVCQCPHGFHGINCDVKVNSCRISPCANGGTCFDVGSSDYRCSCPAGFSGKDCETNVDDCSNNPCQNAGTCIDFVNDYKCYCNAGFIGNHCETNVNDCVGNPCKNGGQCIDAVNDFVCQCKAGFTGKDCSFEINECHSMPCMNNGFCVDLQNDYECRCLPGYSGKACHILPDGTILKIHQNQEIDQNRIGLIVTFSILIPILAILATLFLIFNKHRRRVDLTKANAKANWENELNALQSEENVNIINTIKMTKQKNSSVQESSYIQVDRKVSTHAAAATNVDCAYNKVFSDETLSLTSASCKQTFDCGASSASSTTTTTDNDDVCRPPQPKTLNKTFDACCSDVKHSTPTKVSNFDVDCSYSRFQTTLKMENSPEKIQSNSFRTKIEELCSKNIIDL